MDKEMFLKNNFKYILVYIIYYIYIIQYKLKNVYILKFESFPLSGK